MARTGDTSASPSLVQFLSRIESSSLYDSMASNDDHKNRDDSISTTENGRRSSSASTIQAALASPETFRLQAPRQDQQSQSSQSDDEGSTHPHASQDQDTPTRVRSHQEAQEPAGSGLEKVVTASEKSTTSLLAEAAGSMDGSLHQALSEFSSASHCGSSRPHAPQRPPNKVGQLSELAAKMHENQKLQEQIDDLIKKDAETTQEIADAKQEAADAKQEAADAREDAKGTRGIVLQLGQKLIWAVDKLGELESQVKHLKTQAQPESEGLAGKVDDALDKLGGLKNRVKGHGDRLDRHDRSLDRHDRRLDGHRDRLHGHRDRLNDVEDDLDEYEDRLENCEGRSSNGSRRRRGGRL